MNRLISNKKIVILNECFFNKKHLEKLRRIGEVKVFKNTNSETLAIQRLKGAEIAIVDQFLTKYSDRVLQSSKSLKLLALNTTSYADVDLDTATKLEITVTNVPGFSKRSVAELAIGLMFAVNRNIAYADRKMRESPFELDPGNKSHLNKFTGFNIKGKILGIIGLGRIGEITAEIGKALGMKVIAYNRTPKKIKGVKMLTLNEVIEKSDVICDHLALNEETRGMINKKLLKNIKPSAILINTSRPEVVNLDDIYDMLKNKEIAGFASDIGDKIKPGDRLLQLHNTVFTAHVGSYTKESFYENLPDLIVENIENFAKGQPQNVVNK